MAKAKVKTRKKICKRKFNQFGNERYMFLNYKFHIFELFTFGTKANITYKILEMMNK